MTDQKKPVTLERLLKAYINIRDTRSKNKRAFEEHDADLKRKMDKIEVALLKSMNAAGSDQLKVSGLATAVKSKKERANARDWLAINDHIRATGNLDLLQRRLALGAVRTYVDENKGKMPPGIDITTEIGVTVRRA